MKKRAPKCDLPVGVIAQRKLKDEKTGGDVEISFSCPVLETDGETWACAAEVKWPTESPKQIVGHGVDSIQAIVTALSGVWHEVHPKHHRLNWLGMPGRHGLPMLVQSDDELFTSIVFHLVQAEHARAALVPRQLARAKSKGKRSKTAKPSPRRHK